MKQRLKQALTVTIALAVLAGLIWILGFTTCQVSGKRALAAKWFRRESLQAGDMLLVEPDMRTSTQLVVSKLERIFPPDESSRSRVGRGSGRHATSRRIAQSILDMDFKPTYSVKLLSQETNNAPLTIHEHQIKGKIIKVFGS